MSLLASCPLKLPEQIPQSSITSPPLQAVDVPSIKKISFRDQPGNSSLGNKSKIDPFDVSNILR